VVRKLIAEALGTGVLVFFGAGVATLMFGFRLFGASTGVGVVATALAFGLVLLALVYTLGRIRAAEAVLYWIAQFAGGILGALLLWATLGRSPLYDRHVTGLGANGWGAESIIHISMGGAFLAEVILTAVLVFIILTVTGKTGSPVTAGLVIGLTLTVIHLVGIPLTGTSVNPARSLGPALIVGGTALSQVWLFIVAPLVGGVVAAGIHRLVHGRQGAPEVLAPESRELSSAGRRG
jgi:aquaporin Z